MHPVFGQSHAQWCLRGCVSPHRHFELATCGPCVAYIQATRLGLAPLAPLAFASQVRCPRMVGLASAISLRGFCSLHVLVSCAHSHSSHARVAVAFITVLPSSRKCRTPSLVRIRPPPSLVQVHSFLIQLRGSHTLAQFLALRLAPTSMPCSMRSAVVAA